jgi:hypothetical protein
MSIPSTGLPKVGRKLAIRRVMERYGICDRTVDRWVAAGVLPPHAMRINNVRYWDEAELEAADRERMTTQARPPATSEPENQSSALK